MDTLAVVAPIGLKIGLRCFILTPMSDNPQNKRRKGAPKKSGAGLAFFALALLVLLVVALANQNRIAGNLKRTGFFDKMGMETPSLVEKKAELEEASSNTKNEVAPIETALTGDTVEIDLNRIALSQEERDGSFAASGGVVSRNEAARQQRREALEQAAQEDEGDNLGAKEAQIKKEIVVKTDSVEPVMKLKLYFMTINSDGSVSRKEITREMKKSPSPLADSIRALISGPLASESGCRSLLSDGTRLISASVKNGVATLNFSGEFEFNQYGIEGLRGQLQQIVYTATAFPTVESVQFLVDGERREYLGSEGVWIGTPLGRGSF